MKKILIHLKDNEPVRIKCDSNKLNSANKYEFIKDEKILTQYNFNKKDVLKIDDPPKLTTDTRIDKPKLR